MLIKNNRCNFSTISIFWQEVIQQQRHTLQKKKQMMALWSVGGLFSSMQGWLFQHPLWFWGFIEMFKKCVFWLWRMSVVSHSQWINMLGGTLPAPYFLGRVTSENWYEVKFYLKVFVFFNIYHRLKILNFILKIWRFFFRLYRLILYGMIVIIGEIE